ncbi:RluA family pseudouridine synthase [Anaerostipes sp.]|uniref:RluA family pseudouridine synthase n=1 Tax=Anaerostipes sp. TaxID=1872530 RepID=UPI0025BE12CF|nr:RluA family pseudouridine synthase [Anaerostipes sp.]MBS7008998.1 RluA family pseudouridine synthase [Anaerostipes sp.]
MRRKKDVKILYKDDHIAVCEKPAGMPAADDKTGDMDVFHSLKNQLFYEENLDREPELYMIHRLDRPVGGVMVFARTKEAAAELSQQVREHIFEKDYQAVAAGWLPEEDGVFTDYLKKDEKKNLSAAVKEGTPGAKKAQLSYEVLDMVETGEGKFSYCLIHLMTGRHHQIRVQFAERGFGLYGDTKYNPKFRKTKKQYEEIGLYATRICFLHPETGEACTYKAEPRGKAFRMLEELDSW